MTCIKDLIEVTKLPRDWNGCPCPACQAERPDISSVTPPEPRRVWRPVPSEPHAPASPPRDIVDRKKLAAGDED